jgi:hypothetical protein
MAWAAHAGIDWDWALAGVTLPALLCGVALTRWSAKDPPRIAWGSRIVVAVVCGTLVAVAALVLVSDIRIRDAQRDASGDPAAAIRRARSAASVAPWSSEPYVVLAGVYRNQRAKAQLRAALDDAISRDSSNWILWRMLAATTVGSVHQKASERAQQLNPLAEPPAPLPRPKPNPRSKPSGSVIA